MASERVTVEDVTDVSEEEEEEAGAARPAVEKPKDKNEMKGTVCIFSPYLNKNKTIQEVASSSHLLYLPDPASSWAAAHPSSAFAWGNAWSGEKVHARTIAPWLRGCLERAAPTPEWGLDDSGHQPPSLETAYAS